MSLRNKQRSRAIPMLAGVKLMPQGTGIDVWLSLTMDRYLKMRQTAVLTIQNETAAQEQRQLARAHGGA
jgi:hypothetical protein